ncbi:MAG: 4Fe-4S binding protein [Synergistaceae bacterium]|nr:4Fe-4S binding protein [Synergistaceae bacterium]
MKINKLHLIYFSPSGSTEKIVKEIASVIEGLPVETHNLLTSQSRKKYYKFGPDDLVIMGSISAGKLFTLSEELFACLEADNTPFIGVITYGNAYYGIALKEMLERAEKCGFKVAALGAFIARYSIDTTLAEGRPDSQDKEIIHEFGRKAYEKILQGDLALHDMPKTSWGEWDKGRELIAFREKHPEVPYTLPPEYKAKEISDSCIKCRTCERNCPTDAINIDTKTFDLDKCIGCWGCINRCPKHAISSTSKEFADIVKLFVQSATKRLEPDLLF